MVNALLAVIDPSDQRKLDVVRCMEKFLSILSKRNSYGIPVGPPASRILAEALLIDIDAYLQSEKIRYYRWVDDFVIPAANETQARTYLNKLEIRMHEEHGLTLHTGKTNILCHKDTTKKYSRTPKSIYRRVNEIILKNIDDHYSERDVEDLSEEEVEILQKLSVDHVFKQEIKKSSAIDYSILEFVMKRANIIGGVDITDEILLNLEKLFPAAKSLALYFIRNKNLTKLEKKKIGKKLLLPILSNSRSKRPPDYYTVWVLSIFSADNEWDNGESIVKIYRDANNDTIRRYAALALRGSGSRQEAIDIKHAISSEHPLVKTALLFASGKLAKDERNNWLKTLSLSDPLEKIVSKHC